MTLYVAIMNVSKSNNVKNTDSVRAYRIISNYNFNCASPAEVLAYTEGHRPEGHVS